MYFEILKIMLSFSVQTGAALSCHFGYYYEACLYYGRSPEPHSGQSHSPVPDKNTDEIPCLLLHPQTSLLPGCSGSSSFGHISTSVYNFCSLHNIIIYPEPFFVKKFGFFSFVVPQPAETKTAFGTGCGVNSWIYNGIGFRRFMKKAWMAFP